MLCTMNITSAIRTLQTVDLTITFSFFLYAYIFLSFSYPLSPIAIARSFGVFMPLSLYASIALFYYLYFRYSMHANG